VRPLVHTLYETGRKFNRLTLVKIKYFKKDGTNLPHYYWFCKCDCGNEIWIRADRVQNQKSCGCIRKELFRLEKKGDGARNQYFTNYRLNAKAKNLEFGLTMEEFEKITSSSCHYCGDNPSLYRFNKRGWGGYLHNGIDRMDSSKGYTLDNCVPCCKTCNFAKNTVSYSDFLDWIGRLIKFRSTL
jgi:hypothetical protein